MRLRQVEQRELEARHLLMTYGERVAWAGAGEGRLRLVARIGGYKPGWVWHRRNELAAARVRSA
jgi:hypothetical protein